QLCKTRNNLLKILDSSTDFTLLNSDEVLAHVDYKIDSPKKEEDEYDWHTNDPYEMESDWNADDTNNNEWHYDYGNNDYEDGKWSHEDTFSVDGQHLQSGWDN
ncbi:3557_t:CDS:1, partial [Scutellospora calospora]